MGVDSIYKDLNVYNLVKMPRVIGCQKLYTLTKYGANVTGIPGQLLVHGLSRNVTLKRTVPYSRIVVPGKGYITKRVMLGKRVEIACEAITWDENDDLFWLHKPCDTCQQDFMPNAGRVREENMNSTLPRNQLGRLIATKLVLDPVQASDLKSVFYCKLETLGSKGLVEVHLEEKNGGGS